MIWNGSAYLAQKHNPKIKMIYPKEGLLLWMDNLSLMANATHTKEAYAFINYPLRPEISAKISSDIGRLPARKRNIY